MSDRRKQWAQWANLGTTPTYSIPEVTDEQAALAARRLARLGEIDLAPMLGLSIEAALEQTAVPA